MAIAPIQAVILLGAMASLTAPLSAHDPITTKLTWAKEISRLFAARCTGCHQTGGASSFPLSSYAQARPWAVAIREEILARRMPPWNAVRGFGRYSPDPSLSQEEIRLIVDWVNGGAPEGDPRLIDPAIPPAITAHQPPAGVPFPAADRLPIPSATLLGLRVLALPSGGDTRLLLQHPGGRLQPLAWLRPFTPHAPSIYTFAQPVTVPQGSILRLWPPRGARLELISAPSPNPPPGPE